MIKFLYLLTTLFALLPGSSFSQVSGCTDPRANNYLPSATINDGSCSYNVVTYTPPVKVDPLSDSVAETSGLQWAGGFLWTFNDSGGQPELYKIDSITNTILQRVILAGAQNIDWEDITFDGVYFYIGDFGNNANGARTNLCIYKFPLSAIPDASTSPVATVPSLIIERINFTYSDQPQPPVSVSANATKFDCEAMVVDNGKIHLFTKNWVNLTTTHYLVDGVTAGNYVAMPLEILNTNYLVTAADQAAGEKLITLLGYQNSGTGAHFLTLLSAYKSGLYFNGNKRKINLPDALTMGQAEGLTFRDTSVGYISNEKFVRYVNGIPVVNVAQKLRMFSISNLISNVALSYQFIGDGNWDEPGNWIDGAIPPTDLVTGSDIFINPKTSGRCILNIPYTLTAGCSLSVAADKEFLIQGNLILQ